MMKIFKSLCVSLITAMLSVTAFAAAYPSDDATCNDTDKRVQMTGTGAVLSVADTEKDYSYAWIMGAQIDDGLCVKLYGEDGASKEYYFADEVDYWAPGTYKAKIIGTEDMSRVYGELIDESKYINAKSSSRNLPIKMCKYSLDDSGKISMLYVAVSDADVEDENALLFYERNMRNYSSMGRSIMGYILKDNMIGFSVPAEVDYRENENYYKAFSVNSSDYLSYDGGVYKDFVVGDIKDGRYPHVLVEFNPDINVKASVSDIDTASSCNTFVYTGMQDGKICGMRGTDKVSYSLDDFSALYSFTGFNFRSYDGRILWSADEGNGGIEEYLVPGDILGLYETGGVAHALLKFISIKDIVKDINNEEYSAMSSTAGGSTVREMINYGMVEDCHIDEEDVYLIFKDAYESSHYQVWISSDIRVNLIEYTADNTVTVSKNAYRPAAFKEGDFLFYTMLKGKGLEAYIIREAGDTPDSSLIAAPDPEEGYPMTITGVQILTADGMEAYTDIPKDKSFIVEASVMKTASHAEDDYFIVAAYADDGSLVSMNYICGMNYVNRIMRFGVNVNPRGRVIDKIKVLAWDDITGAVPLAEPYEIIRGQ